MFFSFQIPIADLDGKTVGLYFGAHWCPPCHVFTKQLKEVYNELKILRPGSFEVIFVSIDRSKGEFQASMSSMPWLAIPYSDAARKKLTRIFAVKGIPGLLILGLDGKALKQMSIAPSSSPPTHAPPPPRTRHVAAPPTPLPRHPRPQVSSAVQRVTVHISSLSSRLPVCSLPGGRAAGPSRRENLIPSPAAVN
jgi:thiol-disulfide isomerase/thioredoxin